MSMTCLASSSHQTLDAERKLKLLTEQDMVLTELRAAASDFWFEKEFGRSLLEITQLALALGNLSIGYDGKEASIEEFLEKSQALTSKALDFLEKTKYLVIYEP